VGFLVAVAQGVERMLIGRGWVGKTVVVRWLLVLPEL
jgi:hypothetical protein